MGLKLVNPYDSGIWYVRGTTRDGKEIFKSTKTTNKKAAGEILTTLDAKLLNESIHGRTSTITLEEAVSDYLDAGGSKRFLGEYDEVTGKWDGLIGHFGPTRLLSSISQTDLDAAANKLFAGTKHNTRNRQCHAPFIAVYNRAVKNKHAMPQIWERPRKQKGTMLKFTNKPMRAGTTATTYDRAAKFVLAMSPAPAMLMTTFFYTGMRPIELFTLEADQVNVEGRWIVLPESKSGEPRGVPMHEVLVPLFTGLMERGGFLFRTPRGAPYEPKDEAGQGGGQIKTAINGARRRSGIVDIAPYTGRHTVSSRLVLNGVHPYVKDQIMGHAKAENDSSRRYVHIPQPNLIEAINTLPVIEAWATTPWMHDPLAWAGRLAEGTGKRNDLTRKAA
jgi:integrase/recombinase XerD